MALKNNQRAAQLGKLYKAVSIGKYSVEQSIDYSIWTNKGTIDIHSSDSAVEPTSLSDMRLVLADTGVDYKTVENIPTYISFTQNTDVTTEIVLTGVELFELGDIS